MGTLLEDTTVEGDLSCNNLTVRGGLTVGGIPLALGFNAQDQGVPIANNPHQTLNVVGPNVVIADAGAGVATLTCVPPVLQDEGAPIAGAPHQTVNYTGGGVAVTNAGLGVATVTIPGIVFSEGGVPIAGAPHTTLNGGDGIVISDSGAGVALITGGMQVQEDGVPIPNTPQSTLNFVGNGVTATDAPGSIATVTVPRNCAWVWGADDVGAAAESRFLTPGHGPAASLTDDFQVPVPFVGASSVRCLFVRHNLANGNGNNVDYTVFVNGVATAITVSLATGAVGQGSDMVNAVAIVQGDRVSIQATKALAIASGLVSVDVALVID